MKVLITGATGFLGFHLCQKFISEGYQVTILRRLTSDTSPLKSLNLKQVVGDVMNIDSLNRAVEGQDVVIHTAACIDFQPELKDSGNKVNMEGTQNLVATCKKYEIKRMVHVSTSMAVGQILNPKDSPADETFHFNLEDSPVNYPISKRRGEEIVMKECKNGLDAVVVNPGFMFGAFKNHFRGPAILEKTYTRRIVDYYPGGVSVVSVYDVVNGIFRALTKGRNGERYILGGENVTYLQIGKMVAQNLRVKRSFILIPPPVTGLAERVLVPLGKLIKKQSPVPYGTHYFSNRFDFYNSNKAKKELGYNPEPNSCELMVKEYLDYRSNKSIN